MTENPSQQPSLSNRLHFGSFEVDLHTQELWKEGVRLKVARQPFQILATLLRRPGQLVTREELQQQLWSEETFTDFNHGLNAAVNKLRETLHDTASDPKYIETLPRRGYRFIGVIQQEPEPVALEPVRIEVLVPAAMVQADRIPIWRRTESVALVTILLAIVGVIALRSPTQEDRQVLNQQASSGTTANAQQQRTELQVVEHSAKQEIAAHKQEVEVHPAKNNGDRSEPATESVYDPPPPVYREASTSASPSMRTIISDGGNAAPQFSPDGRRIAFMSNRSGPWQIWVSNVDGSHPVQLSHTDSAGTPRWSPDGRYIAFDAPADDGTSIFVISSDGRGTARELVQGQVPSFSRDGRWVYFASDRSNGVQVWKVSIAGGAPQQVTYNGGFAALEGTDGYIYYSKEPGNNPEICRVFLNGGEEDCTLPHLRPRTWSSWAVTRNGIIFAEDMPGGRAALSVYEPKKQQVRDLVWLPSPPVWMGARPDGTQAVVNDSAERRISLVENLR